MKVVQINATYGDGSTGGIVKDIQALCLNSGIECYVAYSSSSLPKEKNVKGYQIGGLLDHKVHAALCRISGKQGYYSSLATRAFLRWLEDLRPDVINIHNLHSNFINFPMLLKWVASYNVALVVTLHDCWYFTGGCPHFISSNCFRWKESCGCCPRKKKDIPSLFDSSKQILNDKKYLFEQISNLTVVGVSDWTIEMAQQGIFKNSACAVINNGIDTEIFQPIKEAKTITSIREKYGIKESFVILGPASKWLRPENHNLLEKTMQLGEDYTLVLYGCNNQQMSNEIISLEKKKTSLVKIGFMKNKGELVDIYNMANVFVNCTHEDTFSLINVEAQACGTPVICYANTGAKETVNLEYGYLVETDDVKSVIEKILQMKLKFPIKTCQDKLSSWVKSYFDKNDNYKKYIQLYQKLGNSISHQK